MVDFYLAGIFSFFIGIVFGSFVNVLIDRVPRGDSVFISRSVCESCKKKLAWYDLIPLLSFLMIGGKCRYCRSKVPFRIFLVEILVGLFFVFAYINILPYFDLFYFVLFLFASVFLIAVFFIDLKNGIIPNSLVLSFTVIALVLIVVYGQSNILTYFLSALGSFLFFLLIFFVTKGKGMGFGDVKFAFSIGLFLGYPLIFIGLYSAFLTGALVSIILILLGKKKIRGDSIPFAPFLVIGLFIAYFWGNRIIEILKMWFY